MAAEARLDPLKAPADVTMSLSISLGAGVSGDDLATVTIANFGAHVSTCSFILSPPDGGAINPCDIIVSGTAPFKWKRLRDDDRPDIWHIQLSKLQAGATAQLSFATRVSATCDWVLPDEWLPFPVAVPHLAAIRSVLADAFDRYAKPMLDDDVGRACLKLVTHHVTPDAFAASIEQLLCVDPLGAANLLANLGAIQARCDAPYDMKHSELDDIERLPLAVARSVVCLMMLRDRDRPAKHSANLAPPVK